VKDPAIEQSPSVVRSVDLLEHGVRLIQLDLDLAQLREMHAEFTSNARESNQRNRDPEADTGR